MNRLSFSSTRPPKKNEHATGINVSAKSNAPNNAADARPKGQSRKEERREAAKSRQSGTGHRRPIEKRSAALEKDIARLGADLQRIDGQLADTGFYGGGYFGYHRPSWGPWGGYGFGYDDYPDVRSYTVYQRRLELEIAAADNPGQNLYESRVVSDGRSNRLEEVMPLMVRTLFTDFPGPSGVTREISIDLDKAPPASRY